MITLYGIPNCDTCRKARKWLDGKGIAHRFHDFRKDGLDADLLAAWIEELGIETLVNRRGTTWRTLSDADKSRLDTAPLDLLTENPTLLKRPVIDLGERRRVGFDEAVQAALQTV